MLCLEKSRKEKECFYVINILGDNKREEMDLEGEENFSEHGLNPTFLFIMSFNLLNFMNVAKRKILNKREWKVSDNNKTIRCMHALRGTKLSHSYTLCIS